LRNYCGSLSKDIPSTSAVAPIVRQLVRAGAGIGASYRAACRARSRAEFLSRMTVEEEDETHYWLTLLADTGAVPRARVEPLVDEANQLVAIAVASIRTARGRRR
jgi:four helix bundle protein